MDQCEIVLMGDVLPSSRSKIIPDALSEPHHPPPAARTSPTATTVDSSITAECQGHAQPPFVTEQDSPEQSFSFGGDDSIVFSSGGSVIYRSGKSEDSFMSSFEALSITSSVAAVEGSPLGSPNHQAVARMSSTPLEPVSSVPKPRIFDDQAKQRSGRGAHNSPDSTAPVGLLNPTAPSFGSADQSTPCQPPNIPELFKIIVRTGKNENSDLTPEAKRALTQVGLKLIPSLHGTSLLPYSRNPSGSDAFRFNVDDDEHGFEPIPDSEIELWASLRTVPLPLPGNARYTQTGRQVLAQQRRNVSAPAEQVSSAAATVHKVDEPPRRVVSEPAQRSKPLRSAFASNGVSSIPTAASIVEQQRRRQVAQQLQLQAYGEALALQAHLARQAQQIQLGQAQSQATPAAHVSSYQTAPLVVPPGSSASLGDCSINTFLAPLSTPLSYPISSGSSLFAAKPSPDGYTQRRPSIVVSPTGDISFVDSSTLLHLAAQANDGVETGRMEKSDMNIGEKQYLDPDADAAGTLAVPFDNIGSGHHLARASAATAESGHHSTRAEQLDRRRRKHRSTLSDATITAHTYVQQGRRKSAMASFPPPGGWRRPSVTSALGRESEHASNGESRPQSAGSAATGTGAKRRASFAPTSSTMLTDADRALRPPSSQHNVSLMSSAIDTTSSEEPSSLPKGAAPVAASSGQGKYKNFQPAQTKHARPSPMVRVEPPTPGPARTAMGRAATFQPRSIRSPVVTTNSGLPTFPTSSIRSSSSSESTVTAGEEPLVGRVAGAEGGAKVNKRWKRRARKGDQPAPRPPVC